MLTLIGLFYLLYSVRLFFINEPMKEYSAIIAITIALLSFVELWLSIYHLFKERKSRNLTAIAFRTMGLALSLFALVNTQSSIFMALGKDYRTVNASSGTISGGIAIALGVFLLIRSSYIQGRKRQGIRNDSMRNVIISLVKDSSHTCEK